MKDCQLGSGYWVRVFGDNTKHPTSENGLHPKAFQSWRWVFLAVIVLATVAISTVYFHKIDGTITN